MLICFILNFLDEGAVLVNSVVQKVLDSAAEWQRSFIEPTSIIVSDRDQILLYLPAEFDSANVPSGTPIKEFVVSENEVKAIEKSVSTHKPQRIESGIHRFVYDALFD